MNCPACTARNLTTQVFSAGRTFTDLAPVASGPEDGPLHFHDPNSTTEGFECINGHRFSVQSFIRCVRCDHWRRAPLTRMLPSRAEFKPRRS